MPPATAATASAQKASAPWAPRVSGTCSSVPALAVSTWWSNPAGPGRCPAQRAANAASTAPPSSAARPTGPVRRTTSSQPATPQITPPARHSTENQASATMNAELSGFSSP